MAYKQAQNRKKRLLKTYKKTRTSYGSGVWFDEKRGFYYRYYPSNTSGYTRALKRIGNKKVRRTPDIGNFGNYKKVYDYQYTLF